MRGLGVDETTSTATVEFDVVIGFSNFGKASAVAHDGGNVIVSFAGIKLAEGPVHMFYVAGYIKRHTYGNVAWRNPCSTSRKIDPSMVEKNAPPIQSHIGVKS